MRLPSYPELNRHFTFACFSIPPILGSAVTFLWYGGALWCVFEILSGRQKFSRDRTMRRITFLFYLYVLANIISFLLNGPSWSAVPRTLLPLVTFLLFPFSYSIWGISEKADMTRAIALGAMTAAYGALILALFQHFFSHMRPEGGAGNALVFSSVTVMAGAASLAAALLLETRWRAGLIGGYLASLLAVVYSESRSAWVVAAILLFAILLSCRKQAQEMLKGHALKALVVAAVVAALSSGVLMNRAENMIANWEMLTSEGSYDNSLGFRLALWEIGTKRFLAQPILGNGPQHTQEIIREGLEQEFGLEATFTHFHNGFLTLMVESGVIGGGAIIAVFLLAALTALQKLNAADENVRFGAMLLVILVLNYAIGGSINIILGQDIIDVSFMIFLITGTFLACGQSMIKKRTADQTLPA